MKVLCEKKVIEEEIVNVEDEGLMSLMGKTVTFFGMNYIYTGKLVGVNKNTVKLYNPKIVYETGSFDSRDWKDAQKLPSEMYLLLSAFESFGVVK